MRCAIKRYIIGSSKKEFDFAWIHISLKDKENRKQVLEAYHDEDGDTKYRYADNIISI